MITIKDLSFSYDNNIKILDNISLSISQGESVCIVGMSGSGKSTLLKLLCDLPDLTNKKGTILINNADNYEFIRNNRGKIGFLFQTLSLLPNLTVEENIKFPIQIVGKNVKKEDIEHIIGIVGLLNDRKKFIYELSGGMKTRVALASILLTKPDILLLDEPFAALDIAWKYELYKYFFKLKEEYKTTDIVVTHDIQESIILSNKIYVLKKDGTLSNSYCINRQNFDIQKEGNFKDFLRQNNDMYLNIQDEILKDNNKK